MQQVRTFIAITLPGAIQEQLTLTINQLRSGIGVNIVRWVKASNIHLTLKFLGEISEDMLPILQENLARKIKPHLPFQLSVQGAGAFPNLRQPRVLWVGVLDSKELQLLQMDVERATQELGYGSEDRPFSAHLTIGRLNNQATNEQIRNCGQILSAASVGRLGDFNVKSVEVYRSQLAAGGSIYTELYSLPLIQRSTRP